MMKTFTKILTLCAIVAFVPLMAESNNADTKSNTTPESASYRPISENPRDDGLYVGLYYVDHGKTYKGIKRTLNKKGDFYISDTLADAIGAGYYTSFLDKKLREWDDTQGVFGISWAVDLVDIKIPFYIYAFWTASTQLIIDKEQKSLCYTPKGIGCVFPYTPHIKNSKAYALPNLDSAVAYNIDSKKDIVFPIAQTSDEKFYQVIIFPHFMRIKDFGSVEESYDYLKALREECSEKSTHSDNGGVCYGEPINAFVPKSAIKKVLPSHPLMRLDSQYTDVPVFFTPPKTLHKLHLDELEKRDKK